MYHYPDGTPVQCVISHCTIGGGAELLCAPSSFDRNMCATLFGHALLVLMEARLWTLIRLQLRPWGFNGTERPGAVYLAAVMAAQHSADCPRLRFTATTQDKGDPEIPADVREKILRFARCAIAVGLMRARLMSVSARYRWV